MPGLFTFTQHLQSAALSANQPLHQPHGAIAQLGERLHGMQEVAGSIPAGSTIFPTVQGIAAQQPAMENHPEGAPPSPLRALFAIPV
jgi:hypothetical protein